MRVRAALLFAAHEAVFVPGEEQDDQIEHGDCQQNGEWSFKVLAWGSALWAGAFLLCATRYAPILWSKRAGA